MGKAKEALTERNGGPGDKFKWVNTNTSVPEKCPIVARKGYVAYLAIKGTIPPIQSPIHCAWADITCTA